MRERKSAPVAAALLLTLLLDGGPVSIATDATATGPAHLSHDETMDARSPVARETFDPGPAWDWRGSYEIVFDRSASSNVLRLASSPSGAARAIGGPVSLPGTGIYTLRWRCRTSAVARPANVMLEVGDRTIKDFEHVIQAGTTDWIVHTVSFVALDEETELRVSVNLPADGEGELRCDDFELALDPLAFQASAAVPGLRKLVQDQLPGTVALAPLVKVPPELPLASGLRSTEEIAISAARNEVEQVQLVLRPQSPQERVGVAFSDLVGPSVISASQLSWRLVGSVDVSAADLRSPFAYAGRVGDPLVPVERFDIPAGENTAVLLQVDVPAAAAPGAYRGEVQLTSSGSPLLDVPLSLTVWDFELPAEPSLHSSSHFGAGRYGLELDAIVDNVLAHRQDAGRVIAMALDEHEWVRLEGDRVVIDFATFDAVVETWLGRGVRRFALPPIGLRRRGPRGTHMARWLGLEPLTPEFNAAFSDYLQQLEPHLAAKGWLERSFLYLWDEPTQAELPAFTELHQLAKGAAPQLRTAVAGAGLPNPALYGLIDIWMPNLRRQILQDEEWTRVRERQAAGDLVGAYGNNRYALDLPLQFVRLWPWTLRRHGLTQTGWYSINRWGADPWQPEYAGRLGAGYFIYPALIAGGPLLDSLRWEALRAGMEDYEYFVLVAERTDAVREALGAEELFSGERLVQHFAAPLVWGTTERDFSPDAGLLGHIRESMGREIESSDREPPLLAALLPESPDRAVLHALSVPGATLTVDGRSVELRGGRYTGPVSRLPGQTAVTITARLGRAEKTILRFWPVREASTLAFLPICHR